MMARGSLGTHGGQDGVWPGISGSMATQWEMRTVDYHNICWCRTCYDSIEVYFLK